MNATKTLFALFIAVFSIVWLNYQEAITNSSQPPAGFTGAPGQPTCATIGCHPGPATLDPNILAIGTIPFNQLSAGYIPGKEYNITVTNNDNKSVFGFSLSVLDNLGNQAGTISLSNPGITSLNQAGGIQFVGHLNASGQNAWTFKWEAPAQDIGPLTFYAASNASTGGGSQAATIYTSNLTVTACIAPEFDTLIVQPIALCADSTALIEVQGALNDASNWQLFSGNCGGSPLQTNTDGIFSVSPTTTTTYYVRPHGGCFTNELCKSVTINVGTSANSAFTFDSNTFCSADTLIQPIITGDTGGVFSASPSGLVIDSDSGTVDLLSSNPGNYVINYSISDPVCPSVTQFNLTIQGAQLTAQTIDICAGESFTFGNQVLTASGFYTDTLLSAFGCDSIVALQLTILETDTTFTSDTFCAGNTYTFGNQTINIAGQFVETFNSANGCDSVVVLTLSELPVFTSELDAEICSGESFTFGTQTIFDAGIYTELFTASTGCDSTVTITLDVLENDSLQLADTICAGETLDFAGQLINETGVYVQAFQTGEKCDSVVVLDLFVKTIEPNISVENNILSVDIANALYQWIDCDNNFTPIVGQTNNNFIVQKSGNYAVEVSKDGCTFQFDCVEVVLVGDNVMSLSELINVYPNPVIGESDLIVDFSVSEIEIFIRLKDLNGRLIYEELHMGDQNINIPMPEMKGIYILILHDQKGAQHIRKIMRN